MVVAVKAPYNNVRGDASEKGSTSKMAQSIPGRRKAKAYLPRNLRHAMAVTRLANAREARLGASNFRYVIEGHVHEAIDPGKVIRIVDSEDGSLLFVSELLMRLPEDLRKRALNSYL
jgi:hypothetical protein